MNKQETLGPGTIEKKIPSHASDIAVIGMACYYPGASNIKELWENILARRVQFRRMLDQRLPLSQYYDSDPKAPEKTYLTKAAFIENYQFDWGRLRIPKKTVESTDIAHWLALDMALRTFEDAGYKLNKIPLQNTGVIVGNTLTGEQTRSQTLRLRWPYVQKVFNASLSNLGISTEERSRLVSETERIFKSAFYPITEDSLAGGLANTIAGRICNYLNLKGGGYIVDGACSSSLLAVATAADALKNGTMDLALAGGVDISLDPFELVGFAKAGALARDKMSVYDQSANGFLPGEGCGFVLLKRLQDAMRDKNYIYAVIKGWGISSDGRGGIMEPSSSGQAFAINRAYKNLEYKIADVDFVEGHGTGTTKGDRVELEGIAAAIEQCTSKQRKNSRACGITSFKSIVGHTKAAAGVGGLIKAILAVNQRVLPPTASCANPNEVFKDKAKNLYPLIQGEVLSSAKVARAGISSAGFGGINCHITVESCNKPKDDIKPKIEERALFVSQQQTEVFVFTSRTLIHLKKIIEKFKEDLRNISIAEMADLAAFLNQKAKPRLPVKAVIVTDSPEHLYEALASLEQEITSSQIAEGQIHSIKPKGLNTHIILSHNAKKARVGFLYPGQGSQRLNMTRVVVQRYQWAQDLFELSKLPLFEYFYKATDKFFTQEEQIGFEKRLADTRITQPAIILSSLVWSEFLSKLGVEPVSVAGHSLGELTAFYRAGAFPKETLMKFAELRGALMAAKGRLAGSMASLFCSKERAEELVSKISGNIIIANINSPTQVIVSGGSKEIDKVIALAKKEDISTYRLNVSNAFHSSLMEPASEKILSSKLLHNTFKPSDIQVYSGISAAPVETKVNLSEYFSKQVISPVNFMGLVENMSKECDVIIEVGPGRVLTDLVKAINKGEGPLCLPVESTAQNDRDLNIVLAELFVRNVPVKWEELYKNRLIKVFVPASRKKFIENQCEHPLKIGNQIIKSESLRFSPPSTKTTQQPEEIIPGGLQAQETIKGKDNIAELLIELTHKITGFEKESISLDSRLLDDLNLDSIKAGELIGQAARALGIGGKIDPSQISHNTLGKIRDQLHELAEEHGKASDSETKEDILKRYHDKSWVRNFIPSLRPEEITTRHVNQLNSLKNIVILSEKDEDSLAETIKEGFKNNKVKIRTINYEDSHEKTKFTHVNCLIVTLPRDSQPNDLNKDTLKEIIKRLNKVVGLANQIKKDAFIVFVQFGGGNFGENSHLKDIASSSAKSLASTLYLERPDLKVKIIDFDSQISDKEISLKIIDELQTYAKFDAVGYDSNLRRNVVYYENSQPVDYKKRNIFWSSKDVVLVTGGAKGITAQCALEFARSTKACVILMGRSPIPKDKNDEINQTLNQFEKEQLKATYYQCDVTDETSVLKAIDDIEHKYGKITGFIHGAGLNSLKRLKQASVTEAFNESLPKVIGAVNVCKALSKSPPKLIAGITSIIGLTGMEGSGWYGLSNEILNLYLRQFKTQHPKTEVVTIAYSVWDEVGMGAKLGSVERLAQKGIGAIPVKEGVKRFRELIENDPATQQVIVAARIAGIDTWKLPVVKTSNFRFIEDVKYFLPQVELIVQAKLNVKDDSYLLDHNWKGSLLFPFVFGFEAMAQAMAYVLGIDQFEQIIAKDINLERPIPVPEDTGITIEIHAQVLQQERRQDSREVKVEIYSQDTGYKEPHFSAIFEILPKPVIPQKVDLSQRVKNVIDLDMQTDIYGPVLFQGKLFQCIEQIHELYYNKEKNKGECVFTSGYNRSTEVFLKNNEKFNSHFLIGEPFFIDSLFQSMQLIIPQDISLPRDIEKIELTPMENHSHSKSAQSAIKRIDSEHYRGDAEISQGKFLLRIRNCRLKVLNTILSNPSANDLVNPAQRDQKIIEDKLAELFNDLGFVPPKIKCLYDGRLEGSLKELRHKIELPLIKAVVEEAMILERKRIKNFKIKWLKSGKPVIEGDNAKGFGVSLSHNHSFLLVISGYGDQGCDIEEVQDRSKSDWMGILGREKFAFLEKINSNEENLSEDCTVLWSIMEAGKKLTDKVNLIEINRRNNYVISRIKDVSDDLYIIALTLQLTKGNKKVFSLAVRRKDKLNVSSTHDFSDNSVSKKLGYNDSAHTMHLDYSGPQGQLVYTKRFPVTFKSNQNLSRSVYFTNYAVWMGEIREYGLYPIMQKLAELTETGGWGIATNYVKIKILGEVWGRDTVEVRLWMVKSLGIKDSTFDWMFEWRRVLPNGAYERVATSELRTTWVRITGHGEAEIEGMPKFIQNFMDGMRPRDNSPTILDKISEPIKNISTGQLIKKNDILSRQRHLLHEESFKTSLEESNLVGNIYFANYPKWLGKTRDLYFQGIVPEYFRGIGKEGEFLTLDCNIDHLQEAMPFDEIIVRMYLEVLYEKGFDLFFEFFRVNQEGEQIKLAFGRQKIVWIKRQGLTPVSSRLPNDILGLIKT
ncbi:MAG: SDR family NAD(P)-dependent oxidoreductase [Candidatus Omnitrophica bacterium]|nr:SDR family NAD(P)-dependent oxidoreductase [Candidatus Omnitrophota bacterium]